MDASLPVALDAIVTKCTQIDWDARYQTMGEVCGLLGRLDDEGQVLPEPRRLTWKVVAAALVVVAAITGGAVWLTRLASPPPAPEHEPVSVVIADFRNGTGDATFDRTLEPMLKIALEDAGFVTAFDRNAIRRSLGVVPPEKLDERAAQEIAVRQGLGVVLAGSVASQGGRYEVSLRAIQAVTGNAIADLRKSAASKTEVLGVATNLAAAVRRALGDETPDSDKRFAMETLSATSLDVVREYAAAAEAMSRSKSQTRSSTSPSRSRWTRTSASDTPAWPSPPGTWTSSRMRERYVREAVRHLDGITDASATAREACSTSSPATIRTA